jgi:hypothetical protein
MNGLLQEANLPLGITEEQAFELIANKRTTKEKRAIAKDLAKGYEEAKDKFVFLVQLQQKSSNPAMYNQIVKKAYNTVKFLENASVL